MIRYDYAIRELAKRHKLDVVELLEAYNERAAIRQYLGGDKRPELDALHEVERMYKIGLWAQPAGSVAGVDVEQNKRSRYQRKRQHG